MPSDERTTVGSSARPPCVVSPDRFCLPKCKHGLAGPCLRELRVDQLRATTRDFGWTEAAERAAGERSKRLAEALAEMLELDRTMGHNMTPWITRFRAGEKMLTVKKAAEALLLEIANAE